MANIESFRPSDRILKEANLKFAWVKKHPKKLSKFGIMLQWVKCEKNELKLLTFFPTLTQPIIILN
jgi:hypothetical protein